ncbi:hypothetical protein SAMN05216226_102228 [Halovenus aranensis]|uniref:Uncharacterized protein n=1 Tax=Halovenus aranensis TaxID=890420 RepID=A0A1G8SZA9_9EURY|nr:hypothetical protein SAMN05216226_102228 [Halovenus aranensis]
MISKRTVSPHSSALQVTETSVIGSQSFDRLRQASTTPYNRYRIQSPGLAVLPLRPLATASSLTGEVLDQRIPASAEILTPATGRNPNGPVTAASRPGIRFPSPPARWRVIEPTDRTVKSCDYWERDTLVDIVGYRRFDDRATRRAEAAGDLIDLGPGTPLNGIDEGRRVALPRQAWRNADGNHRLAAVLAVDSEPLVVGSLARPVFARRSAALGSVTQSSSPASGPRARRRHSVCLLCSCAHGLSLCCDPG